MPGIAGLISRRPSSECLRLVETMLESMQHESFYASGVLSEPDLGVFAGWVAPKGSVAASQVALGERDEIGLVLAGECFAGRDTRERLRRAGHQIRADETGWLVPLYEERGDDSFADLNGVFSGLVIDRRHQRAILFNDRYGMERVYYHARPDGFYFASEAKALLRILPELRTFDDDGLAEFLQYGCTLGWRSLFRGVEILPGGSAWSLTRGGCQRRTYFSPAAWEGQSPAAAESFAEELEETLVRILPDYLEGPEDVGISLTGGLDTRMIMACRPNESQPAVAYTFAGLDGDPLDVRLAARVASACRIPHHVLRIGPDFLSNFASLADRTVYVTDGALGVCGTHEMYLNNQARALSTVRLTGNFGSEILRGMTTFKPVDLSPALFEPEFRNRISERGVAATGPECHPVSFAAFREVPWRLFGSVRAANSQISTRTPYLDKDLVALAFRAPAELRASSWAALRVVRRRSSNLSHIPTDRGLVPASRLSSVARWPWYCASFKLDYWYHEGMPRWLSFVDVGVSGLGHAVWPIGSHKYLPYRTWFRRDLADYVEDRCVDLSERQSQPWNRAVLMRLAKDHREGQANYLQEINAVLTLDAIERLLFRQPSGTER